MEEWRDAVGFEGRYEVSNLGQLRNKQTKHILRTQDKHGYRRINLTDSNGISKNCSIHRMVAMAFIENPENKPQVNHIDGNHANNCVENLEWVTAEENMRHALESGLIEKGVQYAKEHGHGRYDRKDKAKAYLKKSEHITKRQYIDMINCSERFGISVGLFASIVRNSFNSSYLKLDKKKNVFIPDETYFESLTKPYIEKINSLQKEIERLKTVNIKSHQYRNTAGTNVEACYIGAKRNHLTIIGYASDSTAGKNLVCRCDCGNIVLENTSFWLNGKVKSCGCKHDELASKNAKRNEPEKQEWLYASLWLRLHHKDTCCDEWKNYDVFREWAYDNGYIEGMHLHRKDVYGGFNPENCYWYEKQQSSPRRKSKKYSVNGEELTMNEITEKYGLSSQFLQYRLKRGMTIEEAVNTPKCTNGRKSNNLPTSK